MSFLLQCLIVLFLLILSVPLHELCHLSALKLVGSQTKFKVRWLFIDRRLLWFKGSIEPADGTRQIHIPDFWGRYYRIPLFLTLVLGGWGVAFSFLLLNKLAPLSSYDFSLWKAPLLIISALHFIYGLHEAVKGTVKTKLV